ncbi:MAG: FAD-binding protein [Acidimicrobiales bacterium]
MGVDHLEAFASEVGTTDPVVALGSGTHADLGGTVLAGTRAVRAPAQLVEHDPQEMIVRVDVGVTVERLNKVLAASGQMVPLDPASDAQTLGGVLAVGFNGSRVLRYGLLRDFVLGLVYVSSDGELVHAGGQTVKNVTGFDLCRLMVGSLGTLGIFAQVVLKCVPIPAASQWYVSNDSYLALFQDLYRPASMFWDGEQTYVLLEGDPDDVEQQAAAVGLRPGTAPTIPSGHREAVALRHAAELSGEFLPAIGTGAVHRPGPPPARVPVQNRALQLQIKHAFDPHGRFAPGREAWAL